MDNLPAYKVRWVGRMPGVCRVKGKDGAAPLLPEGLPEGLPAC